MQKPRSLIPTFVAGHFCIDFAPCALWIIAPAVAVSMDLTPAELGLLITLYSLGSSLAFFPAGLLADHVSDRGRMLLGTFWWVIAGFCFASFAPGYWSLILLLALAGMGDAAWHPIATGVLVQQNPDKKARILGTHAMGGSFAEVLAPLAAGYLLTYVDWRTALQLSILPTLFMGIFFLRIYRYVPKGSGTSITFSDMISIWQTWKNPEGVRVIVLIGSYNMAMMALLSMVPLYMHKTYNMELSTTGLAFSSMLLIGALTQPVVGHLSDRIGRRPVALIGNFLAALSSGIAFFALPQIWFMIVMAISITTLVAIRSVLLAMAVEHSGKKESTTLGLTFALMDGIGAIGAVLAGIAGTVQLEYVFIMAAMLSLFAFMTTLISPINKNAAKEA
jgi:FSR family fosmidomycin resistance protein-like MFS transporter